MLAVSPHGGVWRSVDAAASWFPVDNLFAQLQPGWHDGNPIVGPAAAMARDPRDPNNVVVTIGHTLARSTDGGSTWTVISASLPVAVPWLAWGRDGSLWRAWGGDLYRSADAGTTFQIVLQRNRGGPGIPGITLHPFQPGSAIAAGGGELYLTNDGGSTWLTVALTRNASLTSVAYAPSNPSVVYAVSDEKFFRSTDSGSTFTELPISFRPSASPVWVDPTDAAHVVVTGTLFQGDTETRAFETRDGGLTGRSFNIPLQPYQFIAGPDFNGTTKRNLYVPSAQGIFRFDVNAPDVWQSVNNGLATAEVVGVAGSPRTGAMVALTENAGTIQSTTALDDGIWHIVRSSTPVSLGKFVLAPVHHPVVIDQANPDYVYVADGGVTGRSTDGGNTFFDASGLGYLLALQPDNPSIMVDASAAGSGVPPSTLEAVLRRTADARAANPSFVTIFSHPVPATRGFPVLFRDLTFAPSRPSTAWAILPSVGLLRSIDMDQPTPTWSVIAHPGGDFAHIVVDPSDSQTVYLANNGTAADNLYRTRDGGATWTDVSGASTADGAREIPGELPPSQAVYTLAIHPDKRSWLYAGTEAGVYASEDDGASWTYVGPTRAPVRQLFWMDHTLVAGTYGRGVYRVDLTAATDTLPGVAVDRTSLAFGALSGGAAFTEQTAAQTVRLTQTGAGTVRWSAVADQPWLTVTPASGTGSAAIAIGVTAAGGVPPNGVAAGSVTISVSGAGNSLAPISVSLNVRPPSASEAPFGVIDTPSAGSILQGSVAVSGWALDDIGVDRVEIWRDVQAGETTPPFIGTPQDPRTGKVFIAIGTFVDGARPDVEAAFPATPYRHRAGWGYLLLTWGLANQGNGPFTLYAYAFDTAGRVSLLGAKSVNADNASATRPFGSIDTPGIGGSVGGTTINFGWALTPKTGGASCTIPASGVEVSIDSGPLQPVTYGDVRSDVAGGFAGFSNAPAAGGHYFLDTTALANGVHTIGWLVTDTCGRVDGIGSRFFTVANSSSVTANAQRVRASGLSTGVASGRWALTRNGVAAELGTADDGTRVVRVNPTERIEVHLPEDVPYVAGPLPIGSSFDQAAATFAWHPGAGFLGTYDLLFRAELRLERLRVVVGPSIRIAIDTPEYGTVLSGAGFTVAGWATDLASLAGSGIDTLHIWAYPVGGGAPRFVGVAQSREARSDVATLYGAFFKDAGFTVTGALPPGTYDLVVYAHSAATNGFDGAQVVRVVVR